MKYDVDEETVFVYVDNTKSTKFDISEGNLNDMEEYDASEKTNTYVTVVKDANDHETARLVYIVEKETVAYKTVTFTVNGKEIGKVSVEIGEDAVLKYTAPAGYSVATSTDYTYADGKLTVKNVTENKTIAVNPD